MQAIAARAMRRLPTAFRPPTTPSVIHTQARAALVYGPLALRLISTSYEASIFAAAADKVLISVRAELVEAWLAHQGCFTSAGSTDDTLQTSQNEIAKGGGAV